MMQEVRELRKKALFRVVLAFVLTVLIIAADISIVKNAFLLFASVIVCFFIIKYAADAVKEYRYSFARAVLQPVFKKHFLNYEPQKGFSEAEALKSGFFNFAYDEYSSVDFISGENFAMAHVKFVKTDVYVDKEGKRHKRKTVKFSGFLIVVNTKTDIKNDVLITPNTFHLDDYLPISYDKKRVKMDSVEFEKVFDVYSDDQIEARRVLNNDFMEKLLNLHKTSAFSMLKFSKEKVYATVVKKSVLSSIPLFKDVDENTVEEITAPVINALHIKKTVCG